MVLAGVGGAYAWTALAGKGAQPAEVIPGTAIGYVRFDLDPSAGQKIAATRFLGKLPNLKTDGKDLDVKQTLWTWITGSDKKLKGLSYDTDVKPWLGDRAAFAVMPGGTPSKPNLVFALQVTDESKAKDGIGKVATAGGGSDFDVTTKNGFALITPKGGTALADLDKGSLATNATFTGDMSALGDSGVASMWFDGKGLGDFAKEMAGTSTGGLDSAAQLADVGRFSMALRFNADFVELAGITRGTTAKPKSAPVTGGAATLPKDTVVAIQVNGLGDAVGTAWPQIQKAITGAGGSDTLSQIANEYGVTLPDDLVVLLGKSLTFSMPDQDFANMGQSQDPPSIGAKLVSTNGKRAGEVLQSLVDKTGTDSFVKQKVDGDKVFLATTDTYLAAIREDGTLGQTDAFKKAVADGDKATSVMFVNLDKLEPTYLKSVPADLQEFTKALSAVGVSNTMGVNGDASFALRLVGS